MGNTWGARRVTVAVVGVLVVAAYAALLVVDALVLDPLAAVPGRSLDGLYAELDRQGFAVGADVATVVGLGIAGVVVAVVLATWLLVARAPTTVLVAALLAVVALGAPVSFASGFALGMDVADGFGVGGAAHTVWAGVRYLTSGIAFVAVPVVLVVGLTRSARRTAAPARPA
ncbi:hypothetical protein [Curtobacterium sp. UCD-KPL2560]|uniref:hypothetical protein n=1 Tax=Curtobacterium sp. UCD-KPL2560 TaxID=1885315 RepID=UPI000826BAA7|nr:hypothetical protein [Curtobacterium sp. UCD-KPL2560]